MYISFFAPFTIIINYFCNQNNNEVIYTLEDASLLSK